MKYSRPRDSQQRQGEEERARNIISTIKIEQRKGFEKHEVNGVRGIDASSREKRDPVRTNNHAIPHGESHVIAVLETIADATVSYPLLAFFQLLQEHEVARDCNK